MYISPEFGFEIAKSSARVKALADNPQAPIGRHDAQVLEASPWPIHQIDAGWINMCLYARHLKAGRRKTDLVGRARGAWRAAIANKQYSGSDRLHAEFSQAHSGLWVQAAEGETTWHTRQDVRYSSALHELGRMMPRETFDAVANGESRDVAGVLAEIIVALTLNEHAEKSGLDKMTVPSQSWNDDRHKNPNSNFDLWQVEGASWRKIQVKSSRRAYGHTDGQYDDDIAVVVLSDYLPSDKYGKNVEHLIALDISDQELIEIGGAIQVDINAHFAEKNRSLEAI